VNCCIDSGKIKTLTRVSVTHKNTDVYIEDKE